MDEFIAKINRLNNFINNDAPEVIGKEAVSHFQQSFEDEAFSNRSQKDTPWKEVKRRSDPKNKTRAAGSRKILTGPTRELADSIDYHRQGRDVAITSDKVYAEVHNKGLKAGRGSGFKMPKRQFIGKSALLIKHTTKELEKFINRIMR